MLDVQSTATYFLLAFVFGMVWYRTLRRPQRDSARMIGFPVLGIAGSDLAWPQTVAAGPEIMGVHVAIAFLASLAAVYIDLSIRERSVRFWARGGNLEAPVTLFSLASGEQLPEEEPQAPSQLDQAA